MTESHDPGLLKRLTSRLAAQKHIEDPAAAARSLLQARGQMDADGNLTEQGKARDALGAEGRAQDRASKRIGQPAAKFGHNPKTNTATLKKPWGS